MKAVIWDASSGMAGDMAIASFVDAGFDKALLKKELEKLPFGLKVHFKKVERQGISGTHFRVACRETFSHGTTLSTVERIIGKSKLNKEVQGKALKIFKSLLQAEAKVHGKSLRAVHLHEAGHPDAFADIVGLSVCLSQWKIKKIFVRNLSVGSGVIRSSHHSVFTSPAPAVSELLKGFEVNYTKAPIELVTPTGAAILSAFSEKGTEIPSLQLECSGFGAGTKDRADRANVLRLSVGEIVPQFKKESLILLETNLDDLHPQAFQILEKRLFKQGALDVFTQPIWMKKMRPAYKLSILCSPVDREKLLEVLFLESPSLGCRQLELERFFLERTVRKVQTKWGPVRFKTAYLDGRAIKVYPEYEDCRRMAEKQKWSFREAFLRCMQYA